MKNPHVNGKEDMVTRLPEIIEKYQHLDLLIAVRDADGKDPSAQSSKIEKDAKTQGATLLCCAPLQEVEIWCLAGYSKQLNRSWTEIRAEVSLKENVFQPFSRERFSKYPDGGRRSMMEETLRTYEGLLAKCDELAELQARIKALLATG